MKKRAWKKGQEPTGRPEGKGWVDLDSYKPEGKLQLIPGRIFRVTGERASYRFHRYVVTPSGEGWIDAWSREGAAHSFRPERVRKVLQAVARNKQEHQRKVKT